MGYTTSYWEKERWSRRAADTLTSYGRCWNPSLGNWDVNWPRRRGTPAAKMSSGRAATKHPTSAVVRRLACGLGAASRQPNGHSCIDCTGRNGSAQRTDTHNEHLHFESPCALLQMNPSNESHTRAARDVVLASDASIAQSRIALRVLREAAVS